MKIKIYISLLLFCVLSCQDKTQAVVLPNKATGYFDEIKKRYHAGEDINFSGSLEIAGETNAQAFLVLHHSLYSNSHLLKIESGNFKYTVPGKENLLAGEVLCRLLYQGKILSEESIFIYPLEAVDKMQNFNGPKSLFANDEDGSMNVSIPHDQYDNPLLPPSKVSYQASYNGEAEVGVQKDIDHLVAYQISKSKKRAGKYLIGSSVNDGNSQEQELIIGAVLPKDFSIALLNYYPFADSRQYIHLKTSVMKDVWGNIVADGTMIQFTIQEGRELVGVYQAFSIGGIANVYIENPSHAVQWNITASLHGQLKSNVISILFDRNVNDFPLKWDEVEKKLLIGPVVGVLGQLAPDGTEVKISNLKKDLEDFIFLEEGKVKFHLAFDWQQKEPKQLEVLIGGLQKIIEIE